MTKSRTRSSLFVLTLVAAFLPTAIPAAAGEEWGKKFDSIEDALKDKLPAPPPPVRKLAAPQPGPQGSHTVSKSMDMASPKLAQHAINGNAPSARSPGKLKLK